MTIEQIKLKTLSNQIQEDIMSYASAVDDEKVFFTDAVLDELCEIVVLNFQAFEIVLNK